MSYQPPSQTRFYRNKRKGKLMGICAGIADYTGFDVSMVRIAFVAAIFLSSGSILPVYFVAGWITPNKPRELESTDREEREFWQSVRRSPTRTAREIRLRLKDIDRRLGPVRGARTISFVIEWEPPWSPAMMSAEARRMLDVDG